MPARLRKFASTQPSGVLTEMPMELSSQTNSTGQGSFWWAVHWAALKAPSAVEWFELASPKLHTTTLSSGIGGVTPSRLAWARATAVPTAFGRWLAMVEVWGGTHKGTEPHTLWRPPEMGSSLDAASDRAVSYTMSIPSLRARSCMKAPER